MQEVSEEIVTVILVPFISSQAKHNILVEKGLCFSPKLSFGLWLQNMGHNIKVSFLLP